MKSARNARASHARGSPVRPDRVVGIGASAGGLEAFEGLFSNLAPVTGLAIVVVQHRNPHRPSLLAGLIQGYTRVRVEHAEDGASLAPDRIYLAPAGRKLEVDDGRFRIAPGPSERGHLDIDHFLLSLARHWRRYAVGVILSGTGSDGAEGLQAIGEAGGVCIAQEPTSAAHAGMPRSAIATGFVNLVLAPGEIGKALSRLPRIPRERHGSAGRRVLSILELVRLRTNQDFAFYKPATVRRRIQRRMDARGTGSLREYLRLLEADPAETEALASDLVIGVTRFFRDPAVWSALASRVIPRLVTGDTAQPVRIWVAGCSTGEEAYTLAVLIRDCQERTGSARPVQIFASDLSHSAIRIARRGSYPAERMTEIEPRLRERYFRAEGDDYRVVESVRRMLTFAQHDLLEDPPFLKMDLVLCRNVLIYLSLPLQQRLLDLVHFALLPSGTLVIGAAESVAARADAFVALGLEHRIFGRATAAQRSGGVRIMITNSVDTPRPRAGRGERRSSMKIAEHARALLRSRGDPAAVLVDEQGLVVFLHGELGRILSPVAGSASLELERMLPGFLSAAVGAALELARSSGAAAQTDWIEAPGAARHIQARVEPVTAPLALTGLIIVSFFERRDEAPPGRLGSGVRKRPLVELARLQHELDKVRSLLAGSDERLQRAVEDALASRQELQSATEELQSTNEELETTKEELLAVNQEMESLNADLKLKVAQLEPCRVDLENLLADRRSALLCLDRDLRVLRYSRGILELIPIREENVGEPLDGTHPIGARVIAQARLVLRGGEPRDTTLGGRDGRWHSMRIALPRADLHRDGVVMVTFSDVTAEHRAAARLGLIGRAFEEGRGRVVIASRQGEIEYASPGLAARTGEPSALVGTRLDRLELPGYSRRELEAFRSAIDRRAEWSAERVSHSEDGTRWETAHLSCLKAQDGTCEGFIVVVDEVTARRRAERDWQAAQRASGVLPAWLAQVVPETDPDRVLRAACDVLVGAGYRGAWVARCRPGDPRLAGIVAQRGAWRGCPPAVAPPGAKHRAWSEVLGRALRTRRPYVVRDPAPAARRPGSARGTASTVLFALKNGERLVGVLAIRATEPDAFGAPEQGLLVTLAETLARRLSELTGATARRR